MSFGESIKELRLQCLLSQEDFAKELGVSFSTVNRWEREHTKPNFYALKQIDTFCKKRGLKFIRFLEEDISYEFYPY